jgi:hypothetical protein
VDGKVQIGSVSLPPGRRHYCDEEDGQLAAWVTATPLAEAGRTWLALSRTHASTGLVPVLLADVTDRDDPNALPFFGFYSPADVALLNQMSAAALLTSAWEYPEEDPQVAASRAPFLRKFPGLAPAESTRLPPADLERALAALPPAYLGLVAAGRPADVPARVGWSVFGVDEAGPGARSLEIGAVLRSWERRFGARLLRIGSDAVLQVLVERPPSTPEHARRVAAEHFAFADECGGNVLTVTRLADALVGAPIWTFWWD